MTKVSKRRLLYAAGVFAALVGVCAGLASLVLVPVSYGSIGPLVFTCLGAIGFYVASVLFRKARAIYTSPYKVEFDSFEVRVLVRGKLREKIGWSEIQSVGISIDDSFLPVPWWILFSSPNSGCRYPSDANGAQEMLSAMQNRLPAFDNLAVVRSMGLMEGGELIWSRERGAA